MPPCGTEDPRRQDLHFCAAGTASQGRRGRLPRSRRPQRVQKPPSATTCHLETSTEGVIDRPWRSLLCRRRRKSTA